MRADRCASSDSLISEYGLLNRRADWLCERRNFTRLNNWSSRSKFRGEWIELGERGTAGKPSTADGGGKEFAVQSENRQIFGLEKIEAFLDLLVRVESKGYHLGRNGETGKRWIGCERSHRLLLWAFRCRFRCRKFRLKEPWGFCIIG